MLTQERIIEAYELLCFAREVCPDDMRPSVTASLRILHWVLGDCGAPNCAVERDIESMLAVIRSQADQAQAQYRDAHKPTGPEHPDPFDD